MSKRCTRQHTLRCLEPSKVPDPSFRLHRRTDPGAFPEFGSALVRALSVRLSWVTQLALGLETGSALERICTVLLALSERFGEPREEGVFINLHLTHDQLAAIAGVYQAVHQLHAEAAA